MKNESTITKYEYTYTNKKTFVYVNINVLNYSWIIFKFLDFSNPKISNQNIEIKNIQKSFYL